MKPTPGVQQPLLVIGQNTMGVYNAIGTKYCNNTEVIDVNFNITIKFESTLTIFQVLCGLLKHIITTLMDDSKPLINDVLQLVVSIYRESPQSSVLTLSKTVSLFLAPSAFQNT